MIYAFKKPNRWLPSGCGALAVLIGVATPAAAAPLPRQASPHEASASVVAWRVSTPIIVDGRLDDDTWQRVPATDHFLQRDPVEGQPPSERTELRVAYDNEALYIALRMWDREAALVGRRLSRRDRDSDADSVAVYLDPRHDQLTGAMFEVSAAGVQRDAAIYNDWQTDRAWDGVWRSAVSSDEQGWTAELRVPFSQLRYAAAPSQVWGINVSRYIRRKNETVWLELVPKTQRRLASRMAQLVGLDGIRPGTHLELLPYAFSRSEFINPASSDDPFNDGSRLFGGTGLDLKWTPTPDLALTGTINPDFGQVEVDPSVINLTVFETFFQEKRPFFLEGAQIFNNFGHGGAGSESGGDTLFYSRRIGRAPQGPASAESVDRPNATTILGAAKLTGKTSNGWSVGLSEALTGSETAQTADGVNRSSVEVEPLTNYLVGRLFREQSRTGLGLMGTATIRQFDSSANLDDRLVKRALAVGTDGYVFIDQQRDWVVSGKVLGSWLAGSAPAIERQQRSSRRFYQRPDAPHLDLDPGATSLNGWSARAGLERTSGTWTVQGTGFATSPGFETNDLGFQRRADTAGTQGTVTWSKYNPDRFTLSRSASLTKSWRWNFGGDLQADSWFITGDATFLNYWYISASQSIDRDAQDDRSTRGGPSIVSPANHSTSVGFGTDGRRAVSASVSSSFAGDEFEGWSRSAALSVSFKPIPSISISTGPSFSKSRTTAQYVQTIVDATAVHTFGSRYVFGGLDQSQFSMVSRINLSFSPTLSLQVYAEPFLGVGDYDTLKELSQPRTFAFIRYGLDAGTIEFDSSDRQYLIDPDGDGPAVPFTVADPSFNVKSLILKAVLRWEWRPGSTLYAAWTQQRYDGTNPGDFSFGRDVQAMLSAPTDDVFLVKVSYWLGR